MKRPNPDKTFDVDTFIGGAATATIDRTRKKLPKKEKSPSSKEAAEGFTRASFDLPDDLHMRLKIAAAKSKLSMRELVQEGVENVLKTRGY